ncbi:aliphatic sulfonate ABC transporter substrate-binding protein [Phycicoccus sp. CSK15P-2]|uniref:aliphatic sulfonate ABC transporter substrate-binding protein n=1 Tax=Phycicoccus sp. CSK15P-2 TaxID=2807627 RepID=UPI00194F472C|nr:aliphatic sulfonate ABC transporter substrate-binding protein [Phycicoccus sp. CSK15P-2]MBM6404478.1 aliphatic sulfonate ABC transporter substrate-binding protein [Phycicoccus sp. CSK15P-2]
MRTTRRTLLATALTASLGLGLAACGSDESGSGGDAVETVKFGYIADYNGTSLLAIANDQGLWEKHGLEAETPVFTNGPLQIQALGAGDLDFGYIGPGAMWLPASGQAKVIAINTLGNSDRVIAQQGITSLEQLEGKKVGVPEGTSGDMILSLALEKAGLTKDDVELTPMDPSTIVSAFSSGQIDAAGFWYPAIATIKEQDPDLVELAKNSDFTDVQFPTAFVAGNDVVDQEKTTKTIAVLREAMAFRAENPEEAVEVTAKMLGRPVEDVQADADNNTVLTVEELDQDTQDGTVDSWLDGMQTFFVDNGKLDAPADPKTWYTGDLFTGAAQ